MILDLNKFSVREHTSGGQIINIGMHGATDERSTFEVAYKALGTGATDQ